MFSISARIFLIFVLVFFWGCSQKNQTKIEYYPNGNIQKIYSLDNTMKLKKEIFFYLNGNIKSITNYVNGLKEGEQLNFNDRNGLLKSKLLFINDSANGVAYWFYESGSLRASRNYIKDKEWHVGFDYWDGEFIINKSLLRFNSGKVYYKLNFDSSGKPTYSEGDSLHSGIQSVK